MQYNITEVLSSARKTLLDSGVVGRDAEFLLEKVLGRKINSFADFYLSDEQFAEFMALVARRSNRESMDSIYGYTEFLGNKILFNKNTLSPRQETEIMTDAIIMENKQRKGLQVLDMCSGSGCIGLALSKYLDADVTLADISIDALESSQQNARLNNINVKFVESDLFENIDGEFDIIVSNPPYIPTNDLDNLETEVVKYDPMLALDGGIDGLDFYRRLSVEMSNHLRDGGLVYLEFGIYQADDIVKMLKPYFDSIEVKKDYSGIDRYIKARKRVYVK